MKDVLMIMHAREIPECMKAFNSLNIDKVWFTGYTEEQLQKPVPEFIANTAYENYIMASDDLVPTDAALQALRSNLQSYPVLTGWCNMAPSSDRAATRIEPFYGNILTFIAAERVVSAFPAMARVKFQAFPRIKQVNWMPSVFRTYFMAMCFTSMRRDLWLDFPFKCMKIRKSFGSDWVLSERLRKAKIPMYCLREAFFYHLATSRNRIVGSVKPEVIFQPMEVRA